ncbi:MAG: ankyrin repeat domain-containing protein [Pseudomonadota bacterium]
MKAFPPLEMPSLFLASPDDVIRLRRMAQRVFKDVTSYGGRKLEAHVVAWELAELESNDSRPIQERISRPDDRLSLGIAAFFGERIGTPLDAHFPTEMLDNLPGLRIGVEYEGRTIRMLHPWRHGAEVDGCFPLTGSSFEVLCAISGYRRLAGLDGDRNLPSFLCFASPPSVLQEDDTSVAPWGNDTLLDSISSAHRGRKADEEKAKVYSQRDQLRNFVFYLRSLGVAPRFIADDESIAKAYNKFLIETLNPTSPETHVDPFMGLKSYDVADARAYYGRDTEIARAVKLVERAFAEGAPHFLWIKGSSGVGKSSFLRAGVVGTLLTNPLRQGNYVHHVFRPNQLLIDSSADERRDEPLYPLFETCLKALRGEFADTAPDAERTAELLEQFSKVPSGERGAWVCATLDACVQATDVGSARSRLLVGIDQFEEIVDMVRDPKLGGRWDDFIDFLRQAVCAPRLFVLATLRQRRLERMKEHGALGLLWEESCQHLTDLEVPSPVELDQIIRRPFEHIGHSYLAQEVVQELQEEIRKQRSQMSGRQSGSILPLLSLVLERLHREIGEPKRQAKLASSDEALDDAASTEVHDPSRAFNPVAEQQFDLSPVEITLEEAHSLIRLEGTLGELARRAMEEAEIDNAVRESDSTLDDLLRKLVRWTGSANDDDTQFFLPSIDLPDQIGEEKLARALLRNRILVNEGDGKVKLVHETVTRNWPEAEAFFERERPLYRAEYRMRGEAEDWDAAGRGAIEPFLVRRYSAAAAEMLGLWIPRLSSYYNESMYPPDALLRDYCLAQIGQVCDPRRVVERTPKKTHHLYLAALYDRTDIVDAMLLADPGAVNVARGDKRTALFATCFTNHLEILDRLLEAKADVNVEESEGWQPIEVAAFGGCIAFIERLLEEGAVLQTRRIHPLHWAARYNHPKLTAHLIEQHQTDPEVRDTQGWSPAMFAALGNAPDALTVLAQHADLEAPIALDTEGPSLFGPLHVAAANGKLEAVRTLIELGVPVRKADGAGATALHYAAKNGHVAVTTYLAELMQRTSPDGANPRMVHAWNQSSIAKAVKELDKESPSAGYRKLGDWTPLHVAVENGHLACVRALVHAGADPDGETRAGVTAMSMAILANASELVTVLANHADLKKRDKDGRTPLQVALHRGDIPLAVELASRNPEGKLDYLYEDGATQQHRITPLHKAAASDDEKTTRFLLYGQSTAQLTDVFGRTPLHIAAANGQAQQLQLLLSTDCSDLFSLDGEGMQALDLAAAAGRYQAAVVLIDAAGRESLPTRVPDALHHAARGGSPQIVQVLLSLGYAPDRRAANEVTPLIEAVLQDNADVVDLLLQQDDVIPQRPIGGRDEVTACRIAIEIGASASLECLLGNIGTKSLPVEQLAWEAVEAGQFDAAALLLTSAHLGDYKHRISGVALSALYRSRCAAYAAALPNNEISSSRLEAILFPSDPDGEKEGEQPRKPGDAGRESNARAPTPTDASDYVLTQSVRHGVASDIYAAYDTERVMWRDVVGDERVSFIGKINPVDGRYQISKDTAVLQSRALPWFEEVTLVQLTDPTSFPTPKLALCYLSYKGSLYRLNGTSPPIHEVNAKAGIALNPGNVADYLRFFCFFVRGDEGPFYVLESASDPLIPPAGGTALSVIQGAATPVAYEGANDQGHYLLNALIFYSTALFHGYFAVHPTGMIEMLKDEAIAGDLPIKLECPIA